MSKNHIFAHVCGDEFILMFKKVNNNNIDEFFKKIYQKIPKIYIVSSQKDFKVSFSVCKAIYPLDVGIINNLIEFANNTIYKEKLKTKKSE